MRQFLLVAIVLLAVGCGRKTAPRPSTAFETPAFWVWHRSSALTDAERITLRETGVRLLAWQVAECSWDGRAWRLVEISPPQANPDGLEIVPVFRIAPAPEFLEAPGAASQLADAIRAWSRSTAPVEIQIDFDCPDRLLDRYAGFLRKLRTALPAEQLSATALAGWIRAPGFRNLKRSVSWLAPMFYDLAPDSQADAAAGRFIAMASDADEQWIREWSRCEIPWRAGLPNFERLSLFEADGRIIGHLRGWKSDEAFFHRALEPVSTTAGVTVWRVRRNSMLSGSALRQGQWLVHRQPPRERLRAMETAARESGATSVIHFALPGPGLEAAFTPADLTAKNDTAHALEVRRVAGSLVVENPGAIDLPSRPADPASLAPGWRLEVRAAGPGAFRAGDPGGFVRIDPEDDLPAEYASAITFRIPRLRSGETLASGRVLETRGPLQWRIDSLGLSGEVDGEAK